MTGEAGIPLRHRCLGLWLLENHSQLSTAGSEHWICMTIGPVKEQKHPPFDYLRLSETRKEHRHMMLF